MGFRVYVMMLAVGIFLLAALLPARRSAQEDPEPDLPSVNALADPAVRHPMRPSFCHIPLHAGRDPACLRTQYRWI